MPACLVRGWLIIKSAYFPAFLGWLIVLAGLSYLVNSLALLMAPALANLLFPAILIPPLVGELTMCLWMIFVGVNLQRWPQPRS